MAAFCDMRFRQAGVIGKRSIVAGKRGGNWEKCVSQFPPDSKRTMHAMNPAKHRRPSMTLLYGLGVGCSLLLPAAIFCMVAHAWVLLVAWAEARATRVARVAEAGSRSKKENT
jgi:hypothetical protein